MALSELQARLVFCEHCVVLHLYRLNIALYCEILPYQHKSSDVGIHSFKVSAKAWKFLSSLATLAHQIERLLLNEISGHVDKR